MGSGASHESATAALAAGVSEADIAAHLASLDKKPVTVFYNPGSSNSLSCAIMGSSIGCAELKVIQLTGEFTKRYLTFSTNNGPEHTS